MHDFQSIKRYWKAIQLKLKLKITYFSINFMFFSIFNDLFDGLLFKSETLILTYIK